MPESATDLKILVPIKRVIDYRIKVRVKPDKSDVELSNVKMGINPFDEIAIEEALKLKEANLVSEVIVVTVGGSECQETLRAALALGADRAILQEVEPQNKLYPLQIAKILKQVVLSEKTNLVIMGKQSIDGDNNQTGQMLAALLDWPQGTFASKVELLDNKQDISVTREVDGGLQIIQVSVPCVLTTDLRLNKPRFATLPNIMKAKNKPLVVNKLDAAYLQTLGCNKLELVEVEAPEVRKQGMMVSSVDELLDKLHNVEKVI